MRKQDNTFYCFSPSVMIATFCIEIVLALYTIWRYKLTKVSRPIVAALLLLATFQLAEYMVCKGAVSDPVIWSRIGYVAIAFLPPLGLHILFAIAGLGYRWLLAASYLAAVIFAAFFLLADRAMQGHACLGNYVIFEVAPGSGGLFGLYYYGMLALMMSVGMYYLRRLRAQAVQRALKGLLAGYLVFILPVVFVNIVRPDTIRGIPSIMCGFAVLLAILLVLVVLPAGAPSRQRRNHD